MTSNQCFAAGTLIATANGLIPIEDIQPGNFVWFREAKRYSNIPMSEQPVKVIQSVDRMGKAISGRTYFFKNGTKIMEHSAGHAFEK